jgi:hypothetical protein
MQQPTVPHIDGGYEFHGDHFLSALISEHRGVQVWRYSDIGPNVGSNKLCTFPDFPAPTEGRLMGKP